VLALVLAVLYFGLIELLMIDSARELAEARRFRARIVAETLAENGAELAALRIVTEEDPKAPPPMEDWQGTARGDVAKSSGNFDLVGEGVTSGITESRANVHVRGRIVGSEVRIQYTVHTY
jgi:hypothetical protein